MFLLLLRGAFILVFIRKFAFSTATIDKRPLFTIQTELSRCRRNNYSQREWMNAIQALNCIEINAPSAFCTALIQTHAQVEWKVSAKCSIPSHLSTRPLFGARCCHSPRISQARWVMHWFPCIWQRSWKIAALRFPTARSLQNARLFDSDEKHFSQNRAKKCRAVPMTHYSLSHLI